MLSAGFTAHATAAESAVVDAVADILVGHLRRWAPPNSRAERKPASPVLIHVDGPGRTLFLQTVAGLLESSYGEEDSPSESVPWTVIRFDAWQYQRVAPPWWWLIKAIDAQLRARLRRDSWRRWLGQRILDWWWRARLVLKDVVLILPAVLLTALIAWLAWLLSGKSAVGDVLQWAASALAALTAIVGFAWSAVKALRRHLLVESPAGAAAALRTSDPMADLERRYAFLIRSAGPRVAILIDNLDRCRAEYVVELLEGIQTLFNRPDADMEQRDSEAKERPFVTYLVAADRDWLRDSYLHVYDDFEATAKEPGRPFGLAFLEKIFNLSLRIPRVPALVSQSASSEEVDHSRLDHARIPGAHLILAAERELEVRKQLKAAEKRASGGDLGSGEVVPPRQTLRLCAVRRLAHLEDRSDSMTCVDTDDELTELETLAEPGPAVARHLRSAYCVQRTGQLLGGHAVDDDPKAIRRLGLWTILTLRWPLLAEHLEHCPSDLDAVRSGTTPAEVDEQVAPVFRLPEAQQFAALAVESGLDAAAIRRFSAPIGYRLPEMARAAGRSSAEQVAQ